MASAATAGAYLLVEGKDDKHVIQNLCTRHGLAIPVQEPNERGGSRGGEAQGGGISVLLARVAARLKEPGMGTFGVVVDADLEILPQWEALRGRLRANGYRSAPTTPLQEGWISTETELRRVGVWLMPDNQRPGILGDFVWTLLPADDRLRPKAEAVVAEIEQEELHRYPITHHAKALVRTWLAWQELPGQPMGLAITAHALRHDSPTALAFVAWLRRLFELPVAAGVA